MNVYDQLFGMSSYCKYFFRIEKFKFGAFQRVSDAIVWFLVMILDIYIRLHKTTKNLYELGKKVTWSPESAIYIL